MTYRPPPGWYPDPSGAPGLQYWDGRQWWFRRHSSPRQQSESTSLEMIVLMVVAAIFGGLAAIFAISGNPDAAEGVVILAVLVAPPLSLVMLTVWAVRQSRRTRINRRRAHEAGLAARLDQQHQAIMRGDVDAGMFGEFQPFQPARRPDMPDAEQMRQQAWQPNLPGPVPAVRPKNPAPWHVVTQYPTRQFKQAEQQPSSDEGA